MRRAGDLWPRVVSFDALLRAAQRAARGKRTAHGVARFLERVEWEVLALQREILAGTWRPARAHGFVIQDPKTRRITAVPFRDQVVHHALMAVLEPVFERRMIHDSYACRKGKGQHAALARARTFVRRFGYFLKLDVAAFFPSVPHASVVEALEACIKDRRVLDLCATILRGPLDGSSTGAGLPIGSLTSQWFANLVLDRLDHHVKEVLRAPGYLRYMDDFVVFAPARAPLHAMRRAIEPYVNGELGLRLKRSATLLAPVSEGLPFLGWQVFPGLQRLRPANRRRYRWRLRQRAWEAARGLRSRESQRQGAAALFELLRHGDTLGLRRRWAEEVRMPG